MQRLLRQEPTGTISAEIIEERKRGLERKRQGIVEPAHGHDQKNIGWKQHFLRGHPKARAEFMLIRLAQNIGKIARYKAAEFWERCAPAVPIGIGS
jgi:hypothetical protein